MSEVLAKAWASVEAAGLPEPLRETAFKEAVRLLSGEGKPARQERPADRRPAKRAQAATRTRSGSSAAEVSANDANPIDEDEFFDKIERETGVDRGALELVLYLDKGVPRLNLPARRLGANMKARQEMVAQLLPVARHYGLDEIETSTRVVREECSRLKCLDDKNINLYLGKLTGIVYTGSRDAKVLRVRPPGVVEFERRVRELTGAEQSQDDE
ncbi:MAG TPA: hypothetical protein VHE56_12100 [Mycobacteriales bacterium]|nr:hypothetical protein [Mycobacteriales bacterium]